MRKKIGELSGGNRRKVAISAILIGSPSLVIIDEATRSLDPIVAKDLLLSLHLYVHSRSKTFLFTSKKMNEVALVAD